VILQESQIVIKMQLRLFPEMLVINGTSNILKKSKRV